MDDIAFPDLIARAKQGEAAALADLARHYEAEVRIVARVLLGPRLRSFLDSMDMVQSVHRALFVGLRGEMQVADPQHLVRLAVMLVRRKIAHYWRRLRRQQRLNDVAAADSSPAELLATLSCTDADPAHRAQVRDQVRHVLGHLNATERQLVELRLQGYRTTEIADHLQIKAGTVRVRLTRLRQQLQQRGVLGECL